MRRTPPHINLLAAVTITHASSAAAPTTFVMSSRPPYRGRGRGFSERSYSNGREQYVTGDEHFRSVRDANLGLRRGDRGSFSNQTTHRSMQQHHNPPYIPRPRPRPPPPSHLQNRQFRHPVPQFRPPRPHDHGRPAFRPPQHFQPRSADYREWELAVAPPPPPDCERFIVLSYNILADYLALDHRNKLYFHIPRHMLDWQWRKKNIVFELGLWSADIMCLQEVDRFNDMAEELKLKGYSGIWKMRTGNPVDGCAIFWRTSRFKLLYEECIEFNKMGLRDNVAQICVLEFINQNGSLPSSMTVSSKVVISNIHVLYNPNRGEIKLGQVRVLLDRAKAVSKLWNNAPVVICGDFNCTPKSPLYNFISEQQLDLSGIDRNKVSGQASAVIRAPRIYGSNLRSANGSVQTTANVGDKEVNIERNNSLSDMQNLDAKNNSSENQYTDTILDMSNKSWTNVQHGNESGALHHSQTFGEADSNKESNPFYSEAGMGCAEHGSDAVSTSNQEPLNEKSNLYVVEGNKYMVSDCSATSLQEDDQHSCVNKELESTNLLNVEISSTKPSSQTSVSDSCEEPHTVESSSDELITNAQSNSSSTSLPVDKSYPSTNIDFPLDDKLEKLFLNELDKTINASGIICEDDTTFIASLNNAESNDLIDDMSPSPASKSNDAEQTTYNPSLWTPMDIEIATGNAECTFLEHPLPLRSSYTETVDCSGTRDPSGEPVVTSYNRCFFGTVDYIWRSEGLQTTRVLAPIPKHAMEWTPGFPTKKWGSDHIALVSELAYLKDGPEIRSNVQ